MGAMPESRTADPDPARPRPAPAPAPGPGPDPAPPPAPGRSLSQSGAQKVNSSHMTSCNEEITGASEGG